MLASDYMYYICGAYVYDVRRFYVKRYETGQCGDMNTKNGL